ncbi:hypothetical protein OUZ56_031667 [Daphnia magna]|uniref:Uncharacterized protein n=1 Tax=Daphnia magna TaxID=35525 RepID=A0ABQ9ZVX0_9CRUS|nr:hypothetical protein OUZ56_031667 [Daphnia magna]
MDDDNNNNIVRGGIKTSVATTCAIRSVRQKEFLQSPHPKRLGAIRFALTMAPCDNGHTQFPGLANQKNKKEKKNVEGHERVMMEL